MPLLDLTALSPDVRETCIRAGQHAGPHAALVLANQHLHALQEHAPALALHGFGPEDAAQLTDAHETLLRALTDRATLRGGHFAITGGHALALTRARHERLRARAVLHAAAHALRAAGTTDALATAHRISGLLHVTRTCPREPQDLALQLGTLGKLLEEPALVAATDSRGGAHLRADLTATLADLHGSIDARAGRSTLTETEQVRLLAGLVITLARMARRAAIAASRHLGSPALADLFHLRTLRGRGASTQPASASPLAPPSKPAESPPRSIHAEPSPSQPPPSAQATVVPALSGTSVPRVTLSQLPVSATPFFYRSHTQRSASDPRTRFIGGSSVQTTFT